MNHPYRDIWIGLGVAVAIMLVGAALFHDAPAAAQATAMVGLVIGILVRQAVDPNTPRKRRRATDALILPPARRRRRR
jgi:hypothetical protein